MITPFTARKIKKLEKKQSNNSDSFDYQVQGNNKIFCYPIPIPYSPAKTARSNQKQKRQRKQSFSTSYPKQAFVNLSHTTRGHQVWQKQKKSNQKTYQIIVRQSLRRTQTSRSDNHSKSPHQSLAKSSRRFSDLSEKDQQQDFFYELQGKKCAISNLNKNKTSQSEQKVKNIMDADPINKNTSKKQKYLVKLVNQNIDQPQQRQSIRKGSKVSGLNTLNSSQRSQQNKIAISTTKCLILSENIIENKSCQPGLFIQTQTNFVRAKKKSSGLAKKVAKLQREIEETQIKVTQSRLSSFKDAINKNPKLAIRNNSCSDKNKSSITVSGPIRKKEEYMRIDGWQMFGNEEIEAAF